MSTESESSDSIDGILEELIDRFCKLPPQAHALVETHRLRLAARPLGIVKIDADFGARQTLYAASQDVPGNSFIGPSFGTAGRSRPVGRSPLAKRAGTGSALWELSERLTETKFQL